MSGVIDHFGDPQQSPASRASTFVAHSVLPVAIAAFVTELIADLQALPMLASDIAGWTLVAVYVVAIFHQELARICVRCMSEVPADAPVRAQRRRLLLWMSHRFLGWKWFVGWWIYQLAIAALRARLYPEHDDAQGAWLWIPADAAILVLVYSTWLHHRLRPWCPYCRRWDDGDGPHEAVPDPVDLGVKTA